MTPARGRPPIGDRMPQFSVPDELRERIDAYAEREEIKRAEALRRLIELGLAADARAQRRKRGQK